MSTFIDPVKVLGPRLLEVENPGRYVGGEFGVLGKKDAAFRMAIAFPDLYEIGMSNQAVKILYNRLNRMDGLLCDRVFAPAPDFENLLDETGTPLYGLDTGIALQDLDLLGFSLGYELGFTGMLSILKSGRIALRNSDRAGEGPIVIMGGPCTANPAPYARFVDAFWIGEAEAGFFGLAAELARLKAQGAGRGDLLSRIRSHPSVWHEGKATAYRALDWDFARRPAAAAVFPVPSIRVVQHHGAVEIMRGCPNGCRFCQAGIWYRPMRQKSPLVIQEEADAFVKTGGYRELSLSSLSSGDYCRLDSLVMGLTCIYSPRGVSFQLPSLKVSSFSLPILKGLQEVRKSGLTFAVETPFDRSQLSINKEASLDSTAAILETAKREGFRKAKLYFMVGLPGDDCEEQGITAFVRELYRRTKLSLNLNVGTFIPKPQTPFEREAQLSEEKSRLKLNYIRDNLKEKCYKVSVQDPFLSVLEGVISRGNADVGDLAEEAFNKGARLDGWNEKLKREVWQELLSEHPKIVQHSLSKRDKGETLPWSPVFSGTAASYLSREREKAEACETTSPCMINCTHNCGVCSKGKEIVQNSIQDKVNSHDVYKNTQDKVKSHDVYKSIQDEVNSHDVHKITQVKVNSHGRMPDPPAYRMLFSFSKAGKGVFLPHLSLVETFSMAFLRADLPVKYTEGFNPIPALEFASPLATGIASSAEIASVGLDRPYPEADFTERLNRALPEGIRAGEAMYYFIPRGIKRRSLGAALWGCSYLYNGDTVTVEKSRDRDFKNEVLSKENTLFNLKRTAVLAGNGESYFSVFRKLYPENSYRRAD